MTTVIGLTGGIACGKSTVSDYLRQKGISVVDADLVARQVVMPGTVGLAQIQQQFGQQYLNSNGTLNRALLGEKVFADMTALQQLNNITGPLIVAELEKQLQIDVPFVVLDAPLLLEEEHYRRLADVIWVVTVPADVQRERLIARNQYSVQQAQERIAAQMTETERLRYADAVIDNSGTREETYQQVDVLLAKLFRKR